MKVKKELVSIKGVILVWFFFIICCKAANLTSEAAEYKHLGNEKQLIIKNGYGSKSMKPSKEVDQPRSKALKGLYEVVLHLGINVSKGNEGIGIYNQSKKANKGVYGGGGLLRPKSKKGGASSLSTKSSSLMALKTLAIDLPFLLFF